MGLPFYPQPSGKPFDKGKIINFEEAVSNKLKQIAVDISPFQITSLFSSEEETNINQKPVNIISGSCLEELPKLKDNFFDLFLPLHLIATDTIIQELMLWSWYILEVQMTRYETCGRQCFHVL